MPIVLIIVALAVALGVGSYFLRPQDVTEPVTSEIVVPNETTDGTTVPAEDNDTPETNNVPLEDGDEPKIETVPVSTTTEKPAETTPATPTTAYSDGAHSITTSYIAPGNANHTMAVTLTLKDDVVTASTITFGGDKVGESSKYQSRFMSAYESQVIGKKLDTIKLSRVGGASLTTGGFNDAVAKVKATAAN